MRLSEGLAVFHLVAFLFLFLSYFKYNIRLNVCQ
nr:MAG TPA: hypothetical protein [Caudoviricetes sp.]